MQPSIRAAAKENAISQWDTLEGQIAHELQQLGLGLGNQLAPVAELICPERAWAEPKSICYAKGFGCSSAG